MLDSRKALFFVVRDQSNPMTLRDFDECSAAVVSRDADPRQIGRFTAGETRFESEQPFVGKSTVGLINLVPGVFPAIPATRRLVDQIPQQRVRRAEGSIGRGNVIPFVNRTWL